MNTRTIGRNRLAGTAVAAALALATTVSTTSDALMASAGQHDRPAPPRTLYIANGDGNLATFAITPSGNLALLDVLGNLGTELRGLTVAPDGRSAYLVDSIASTVTAFALDAEGRPTLIGTPLPTDPDTPAPIGCDPEDPMLSPCAIGTAMTPNGRVLFVINLGAHTCTMFAIRDDGTLRQVGRPFTTGGIAPRAVAVSPDGERLYIAHRDTDSISVFAIRDRGLRLPEPLGSPVPLPDCTPSVDPPRGACAPDWISISPDGRWLYTTNLASGDLSIFAIGPGGGLTPFGPRVPAGGRPEMIAIRADGRLLYASSNTDNAIKAFTVGTDGRLGFLGSFPVCDNADVPDACGAPVTVIAPDGKALYTATTDQPIDEAVSFGIEPEGTLVELPGSPIPTGGSGPLFQGMAMRPNQGPVASLARAKATGGRTVTFDASASSDPDGRVVRYDWDFGDGQRVPDGEPQVTHTYAEPGDYRVTVTVTDNEGCSDALVFMGQTALCNGSRTATASHTIRIRSRTN